MATCSRTNAGLSNSGFLAVPLGLALASAAIFAFASWMMMRQWRSQVETQFRLDRCVARQARSFSKTLRDLERDDKRIKLIRLALISSPLAGPFAGQTAEVLKVLLQATAIRQNIAITVWNTKRATWIVRRGCDGKRDIPFPLPAIPAQRPPDDLLGPQALNWEEQETYRIELYHRPRRSAAMIETGEKHDYRAHWTN
jgi:hypothetical protein